MDRVYNFSAGPSQLPIEVLQQAQKDMLNFGGTGTSVMEMSHRSQAFQDIIDETEASLRKLMNIPDSYAVLFLQGGPSLQFSMIPMNLADRGDTVAYAVTGHFAQYAIDEASRWCNAVKVSSSKETGFDCIPKITEDDVPDNAKYVHITGNNTVYGTMYHKIPQIGKTPLVADWSSAILGTKIDVEKYDLVYAGAQKNMGIAGVTFVIMKKELLKREISDTIPTMLNYKILFEKGSMYNTPPCWSIYISGLVFKWVEAQGGVDEMVRRNTEKSGMLYDFIDNSKLFSANVRKSDRSIMNVPFTLPDSKQDEEFIAFAERKGLINLKGHKAKGGCRASLYNGMSLEGVKELVKTMKEFEKNHV